LLEKKKNTKERQATDRGEKENRKEVRDGGGRSGSHKKKKKRKKKGKKMMLKRRGGREPGH